MRLGGLVFVDYVRGAGSLGQEVYRIAYSADEVFLTGTFGAQTPVGSIDGRMIGTGDMGPVTIRLRALYRDLVASCT